MSFSIRLCRLTLLAAVMTLATAADLVAASSATVTGTVSDPTGRAIEAVTVTATRQESNTRTNTTTNAAGVYTFPDLQIGTYRIEVSRDGFKTFIRSGMELHVQDEVALNIELELGSVSESISVDATAPTVQNNGMGVSTVIDRRLVQDLPLNGLSFQTLFQLTPGVVITSATTNSPGQFSVNGQRTNSNYIMVDGVSANVGVGASAIVGQTAAGTQMGTTILGGTNNLVSVEALQEFRIQTSSFAPEYGRTPGAQISIVTRSGTNQFHGSAFDYFRNDKLDANDWFANQTRQSRPPERQNDYGVVFGGPIRKDRTFFFFSYEGLRLRQPQTVTGSSVPSLSIRQSAPVTLQPFLNAFPVPNGTDLGSGFALENASYSNPSSLNSTSIRIDQRLGGFWTLFGRVSDAPSAIDQRAGSSTSLASVNRATMNTRGVTGGATWIISPTISNDTRINLTSNRGTSSFTQDSFGGAVPLPPSFFCPPSAGTCEFYMSLGQANSALLTGPISNNSLRQMNLTDSVAFTFGSHRATIGGDIRWLRTVPEYASAVINASFLGIGPLNQSGTLLSGLTSFGSITASASNLSISYKNVATYIQDVWQISRALNVTYGLRWDVNPAPHSPNLWSVTGLQDPAQLALGKAGAPVWSTHYDNVAPRFGVAYNLNRRGGSETVLRGGIGIFYDLASGLITNQLLSAPNTATVSFTGSQFPFNNPILPSLPGAPPYSSTFYTADPALRTPTTYQWSFALQQALGTQRSVTITYLGSKGVRLARQEYIRNPNPTFVTAAILRTNGDSRYNSLQVQYQQHLSRGLQLLASYALSHSIDDASTDTANLLPSQHSSPQADKASSDFDIRSNGSAAVTYALPAASMGVLHPLLSGWALDGMVVAHSAFPLNIAVSRNLGYGTYSYRPDLVTGVSPYISDPNAAGRVRINPAAFTISSDLRQGTLARNALEGFGMYQINAALHKSFPVTEHTVLDARMEAFNLTNHPNFASPNGSLGSVSTTGVLTSSNTFGWSTSMLNQGLGSGGATGGFSPLYQTGGPRSVQLSLKFRF